jgi:hypothetical protein
MINSIELGATRYPVISGGQLIQSGETPKRMDSRTPTLTCDGVTLNVECIKNILLYLSEEEMSTEEQSRKDILVSIAQQKGLSYTRLIKFVEDSIKPMFDDAPTSKKLKDTLMSSAQTNGLTYEDMIRVVIEGAQGVVEEVLAQEIPQAA